MTLAEKIVFLRQLVDNDPEATDELLTVYITLATDKIRARLYPMDASGNNEVPDKYDMICLELAQRYFFRRGGQGEIMHSENGVTRTYGSVNDNDIISQVVPYAVIPNAEESE